MCKLHNVVWMKTEVYGLKPRPAGLNARVESRGDRQVSILVFSRVFFGFGNCLSRERRKRVDAGTTGSLTPI